MNEKLSYKLLASSNKKEEKCLIEIWYVNETLCDKALRALASSVLNAKILEFGTRNTKNQPLWDVSNAKKKKIGISHSTILSMVLYGQKC